MTSFLAERGLRPVINGTGPWTRMGNAALTPRVVAAMAEAAAVYLSAAELQEAADRAVVAATGAEAGYATPGAAAAITLAVAACLAGEDPDRIQALPRIQAPPHTAVMFRQHRGFYDVAVRAAGAHLRTIDARAPNCLETLGAALDADAACFFYDVTMPPHKDQTGVPRLAAVIALAHERGVRVVVDGSLALPPVENLRALVALGADAVCFSGGKAIGGPSASGFIACRRAMVRSMALQHQDYNVFAATTGTSDPHNLFMGLGRGLKVGKEQIAGMIVALEDYARRDHSDEQRLWQAALETIERAVSDIDGVVRRWLVSDVGRAPHLLVSFEDPIAHVMPQTVSDALLAGAPRVFVGAHLGPALWLGAENLRDGEAEIVGRRLAEEIRAAAERTLA